MSKSSPARPATASKPIVFEWLERIGLGYAVPYFKEKNIISPKALTSLTIKDYEELHVSDLSDRKRLYELVQRVRLASRSVKQRGGSEEKEPPASPTSSAARAAAARSSARTSSPRSSQRKSPQRKSPYRKSPQRKSSEKSLQPNTSKTSNKAAVGSRSSRRDQSGGNSGGGNSGGNSGGGSARDVMRKQRAKERIRRLTQSPSKSRKEDRSTPNNIPRSSAGTGRHQQHHASKKREVEKDDDDADLASASPLVPLTRSSMSEDVSEGGGGGEGGGGSLADSRANNAFDILGLRRESFEDAKIRVVVRKRPLSRKEKAREDVDIVDMNEDNRVYLHEPRVKVDMTRYVETHEFAFDNAFDDQQNNNNIYEVTCRPLLCSVFDRNAKATCFAYGQTGSGKTHTMMGPDKGKDGARKEKGLYEMAAEDIFRLVKSQRYQHIGVYVSFFEIYGGRLFDLLNERRKLRNLEDHNKQVQIVGLRAERITNIHDLFELMSTGHSARSTGTTGANVDSSRSHAVLQIVLKDTRTNKPTGGKFSFIDLAGSERGADTTHNNRQTRMEGAEINKSLLALKVRQLVVCCMFVCV